VHKKTEGMLDEKDLMLIGELRKDSKLSEQRLARKTGIPMTTVHNRIRRLRDLGVIERYTVKLDYARIGRPLVAYALIKTMPGVDQREILSMISKIPHVAECAMVTGDFDILLKARVRDMDELNGIIVQRLRRLKTIADTRTMISYETHEDLEIV